MASGARNLEQDLLEEFGTATFADVDPEFKTLGWSGGYDDDRDYLLSERVRLNDLERQDGRQLYANPIQLNQGRE